MANALASLARGLRSAGGVVSPGVNEMVAREDMADDAARRQQAMLLLQRQDAERRMAEERAFRASENAANREAAERRAKEAAIQRADEFRQTHEIKLGQLDLQRDAMLQRAASDAEKRRVDEWYKAQRLEADRQSRLMDERFKALGLEIRASKASPQEGGMTPENAGKVAMAQQSVEGIGTVRSKIFDKDGKLNVGLVAAINTPIVAGLPFNTDARVVRSAIRNAIEAKLRLETGAAATESEVERTLARFMPTPADTSESAKFKLDELEKFFKTSLSQTKGVKPQVPVENDPLGIR